MGRRFWRKSILALGVMFGLMLPLQQVAAHGGGLNSSGCHNETATGGYHCHRDKDEFDWAIVGAVAGGALALWLLVEWLDDDENALASRLQLVPHFDDDGAGIVAEYTVDGLHRVGFRTRTHTDDREDTYIGIHWRLAF